MRKTLYIPLLSIVLLNGFAPAISFAQDETPKNSATTEPDKPTSPPSLRVVKLLWKTQPAGAARALEKAIDQSLVRHESTQLAQSLTSLATQARDVIDSPNDPRWLSAVAALALMKDPQALDVLRAKIRESKAPSALPLAKRDYLLRVWLEVEPAQAVVELHKLLGDSQKAAKGEDAAWMETIALRALAIQPTATAQLLVSRWNALPGSVQLAVIEPMTQQRESMGLLVGAIEQKTISRDLLNTNQLMKWSTESGTPLAEAIERVWGKLRTSDDQERKKVVADLLGKLRQSKNGNPEVGKQVFTRVCSQCHRLHGEGIEVGPDISANGRGSFEQLVSNVFDPSLVIGKAFLAKTILTTDGRVLAGLVVAEDEKRITLKTQGGKQIELDREEDIETVTDSVKSLMPEGLEQQLTPAELVDLFSYLCLVKPLTSPENETIPGTPQKLLAQ